MRFQSWVGFNVAIIRPPITVHSYTGVSTNGDRVLLDVDTAEPSVKIAPVLRDLPVALTLARTLFHQADKKRRHMQDWLDILKPYYSLLPLPHLGLGKLVLHLGHLLDNDFAQTHLSQMLVQREVLH